jgi:hypothetical protein
MLWCGKVTRAAVGNWMTRHPDDVPEPDVIIANENTTAVTRGWALERRDEWMRFAAARLGAGGSRTVNTATRSIRRAADVITRQAESGEISEKAAIELLAALIGTTPVTPAEEGAP